MKKFASISIIALSLIFLIGCSKDKYWQENEKLKNLFQEYLSKDGIQAKQPLLQSLAMYKKGNLGYFKSQNYCLSLNYGRLYVIELLYGDKSKALSYLEKTRKFNIKYLSELPELTPKEKKDRIKKMTGENYYKTIRKLDKQKKIPKWESLSKEKQIGE